jgi:hypothetical protein
MNGGVEMKKYTERGFRNYGEFKDSYGSIITVRQSSSATVNACWVFCHKETGEEFSPHLTIKQAKRLITLLGKFINETL